MTVYVIGEHRSGVVKIGFTEIPPESRLVQLQTGNGTPLTVLESFPGFTRQDEARLHRIFASRRVSGEWFDFTGEDAVELIEQALVPVALERAPSLGAEVETLFDVMLPKRARLTLKFTPAMGWVDLTLGREFVCSAGHEMRERWQGPGRCGNCAQQYPAALAAEDEYGPHLRTAGLPEAAIRELRDALTEVLERGSSGVGGPTGRRPEYRLDATD